MFQVLKINEGPIDTAKAKKGSLVEEEKEEESEQVQENNKQKEFMLSTSEKVMDLEMTLSEMDMEDHELQEILEK